MRKSAKLILTIFIVTILFSNITFAINIPLRVVVNGEELYFRMRSRSSMRMEGRRHQQGLLEKLWEQQ